MSIKVAPRILAMMNEPVTKPALFTAKMPIDDTIERIRKQTMSYSKSNVGGSPMFQNCSRNVAATTVRGEKHDDIVPMPHNRLPQFTWKGCVTRIHGNEIVFRRRHA